MFYQSAYLATIGLVFSLGAQAAPGVYWELTSTMDGMGMSMPSQTSRQCIPLKHDGQPAGVDKSCKITDLKRIANGMTWKMSCADGTTGSGKQTSTEDTISSDVIMNTSDGSMKMSTKGKRVGGSCDTGEQMNAVLAEAQKTCDLTNRKTAEVLMGATNYTVNGAICSAKKEAFCSMVRRDVPSDPNAFESTKLHLKSVPDSNLLKACGLNLESAQKSVCKANADNRSEIRFLDSHCPAEAKLLRDKMRAEACAGRHFTAASDKARCLSGDNEMAAANISDGTVTTDQNSTKPDSAKPDMVKEGTKALKGLKDAFGF